MDNQVNPRDETFCQMLKINFCPTLKLFSFIAIITIIDVIMYVVSLFLGDLDNDDFLGPNSQTLLDLGGKVRARSLRSPRPRAVPEQDALRHAALPLAHAHGAARKLLPHPRNIALA